jgi:hypothetical protein
VVALIDWDVVVADAVAALDVLVLVLALELDPHAASPPEASTNSSKQARRAGIATSNGSGGSLPAHERLPLLS